MQQLHKAVDLWVHDWLSHQGQGTVARRQSLSKPDLLDTGHSWDKQQQQRERGIVMVTIVSITNIAGFFVHLCSFNVFVPH